MKFLKALPVVFAFLVLHSFSFGQTEIAAPKGHLGKHLGVDAKSLQFEERLNKMDPHSGWWDPVNSISLLTNLTSYVSFLMPDTNAVFVPDKSSENPDPYHFPWHSVGMVFDPSDPNLLADDNITQYTRYTRYTVDSVAFPYLYVRYADSIELNGAMEKVVDTLIIQFFTYDNLRVSTFTNPAEIFAVPENLDGNSLTYPNNAYTVKIPLTDEDSTNVPSTDGWRTKTWVQAIPDIAISDDPLVQNRNIAGFQFAFKTMIPINFGDTMETRDGSIPKKRLNYFGHSLFIGTQGFELKQTDKINNGFFTVNVQRYGETQNGWASNIPGNAYFDDRYIRGFFHTNTENLSTLDLESKTYGLGMAYPNPSRGSTHVDINYKLPNSQKVYFKIFDLAGNVVQNIATQNNHAGINSLTINISNLSNGLYLYQMQTNGFSQVKKLVVNK